MVNSEIWDGIVDWVVIFSLWMEILTALSAVADWVTLEEVFLVNLDISSPEWGEMFWGSS
jgi:hypothetical protein